MRRGLARQRPGHHCDLRSAVGRAMTRSIASSESRATARQHRSITALKEQSNAAGSTMCAEPRGTRNLLTHHYDSVLQQTEISCTTKQT